MDEAEVAVGSFVVSRCQSSSIFELVETALDDVAQGVDRVIDGSLDQPVSLGRDHRDTAASFHIFSKPSVALNGATQGALGVRLK